MNDPDAGAHSALGIERLASVAQLGRRKTAASRPAAEISELTPNAMLSAPTPMVQQAKHTHVIAGPVSIDSSIVRT